MSSLSLSVSLIHIKFISFNLHELAEMGGRWVRKAVAVSQGTPLPIHQEL